MRLQVMRTAQSTLRPQRATGSAEIRRESRATLWTELAAIFGTYSPQPPAYACLRPHRAAPDTLQSRLSLEGRARTLSRLSPDLSWPRHRYAIRGHISTGHQAMQRKRTLLQEEPKCLRPVLHRWERCRRGRRFPTPASCPIRYRVPVIRPESLGGRRRFRRGRHPHSARTDEVDKKFANVGDARVSREKALQSIHVSRPDRLCQVIRVGVRDPGGQHRAPTRKSWLRLTSRD